MSNLWTVTFHPDESVYRKVLVFTIKLFLSLAKPSYSYNSALGSVGQGSNVPHFLSAALCGVFTNYSA